MTEFLFQAKAFWDYSSKFTLTDKEQFLSLFDAWTDSKEFSPEDKKMIWEFVNKYYEEKCKEEEIRKSKKPRKQKSKITLENDPRQIEFKF